MTKSKAPEWLNDALAKARDEVCRTIHVSHLHEVLVGFDLAAEAAANAAINQQLKEPS